MNLSTMFHVTCDDYFFQSFVHRPVQLSLLLGHMIAYTDGPLTSDLILGCYFTWSVSCLVCLGWTQRMGLEDDLFEVVIVNFGDQDLIGRRLFRAPTLRIHHFMGAACTYTG